MKQHETYHFLSCEFHIIKVIKVQNTLVTCNAWHLCIQVQKFSSRSSNRRWEAFGDIMTNLGYLRLESQSQNRFLVMWKKIEKKKAYCLSFTDYFSNGSTDRPMNNDLFQYWICPGAWKVFLLNQRWTFLIIWSMSPRQRTLPKLWSLVLLQEEPNSVCSAKWKVQCWCLYQDADKTWAARDKRVLSWCKYVW